jgi:glycosyltransferase involved in cell wall biosynthesis
LKILLLNSEFPPIGGGAGNASANISRHFVDLNHHVAVLTSRFAQLPQYEEWHGVHIYRIPSLRKFQDRSGLLEQVSYILVGWWKVGRLIKDFSPDVVLAFFGIPSGAIAWWLKVKYRIPYMISMRGGDVPGFRPYDFAMYHRLVSPFLRVIWKNAASLVANSRGLRDLALHFEPLARINLIPNGVDLEAYAFKDRKWVPPRLLSVGRLVYQKGLDLAARALAELKDLDWEWVIAGDGSFRQELSSLCLELGIDDRVIFAGWQSRDQLKQLYHDANLFVFPSRHEGMPNAVLEAMASGLPVVASRIAGNEELVIHGETGLLVPAESVTELVSALRQLIMDVDICKKMGDAGRARVEAGYSWRGVASDYARQLSAMLETG